MENYTPRNIVLQLGALLTLYLSASFLLTLVFGIINLRYPDAAEGYYLLEQASENVRLGIAMLIVFFPTFIVLTRVVNKIRREEKGDLYQNVTRWLIYLSLLLGGLILLGTLVTVIYTFLNGEITSRFIFKTASVVIVVGAAFHYYLLDARGWWVKAESMSIRYGIGVTLVVFTAIAFGVQYIETPSAVREMKLDETQINDLRNIQWQIESYLTTSSSSLPASLEAAYGDFPVPAAREEREAYEYKVTNSGFELCATFARDYSDEYTAPFSDSKALIKNAENWNYKAGRYCFVRGVQAI